MPDVNIQILRPILLGLLLVGCHPTAAGSADNAPPNDDSTEPLPGDHGKRYAANEFLDEAPARYRGIPEIPFRVSETTDKMRCPTSSGVYSCKGTPEEWAELSDCTIRAKIELVEAQYCLIDNVTVEGGANGSGTGNRHQFRLMNVDHVVVQNSTFRSHAGVGLAVRGQDVVIHNSSFEKLRYHTKPKKGRAMSMDTHGISGGCGSERIWIMENYGTMISGQLTQWGHGCKKAPPSDLYIAGNLSEFNAEAGFATKWARNVVLSGNTARGHVPSFRAEPFTYKDGWTSTPRESGARGDGANFGADGITENVLSIDNVYVDNTRVKFEDVAGFTASVNDRFEVNRKCDRGAGSCVAVFGEKEAVDPVYVVNPVFAGDTLRCGFVFQRGHNFDVRISGARFEGGFDGPLLCGGGGKPRKFRTDGVEPDWRSMFNSAWGFPVE